MVEITLTSNINGFTLTYGATHENRSAAWEAAIEFARATNQTVHMIDYVAGEIWDWLGD